MLSGNVPDFLVIGARTGFLTSLKMPEMPWTRIANTINMESKSLDLVDLGGAPMPTQAKGGRQMQDFIQKNVLVKPVDWEIVVGISYNSVQDDQTGTLNNRVRAAGTNFQKHLNNRVFQVLNGGDGTTYGLCYDGLNFISASHVDKGAAYQTVQNNLNSLSLSTTNFDTVNVAAQKYLDDQGEYVNFVGNLLVVPPEQEWVAGQICNNATQYDSANRAANPFSGKKNYIVSPQLDSTSWYLIDESEPIKPLIVAMRQQPFLQDFGFDSKAVDGGLYWFKFFSRYEVYYGDWRLATQGHS